jgi:FMN reductase (NADPH)/FMN reductase [NAD(P)H]
MQQQERPLTPRFDRKFVVFENRYRRLSESEFAEMYRERDAKIAQERSEGGCPFHALAAGASAGAGGTAAGGIASSERGPANTGQLMYLMKFSADFTKEMTRSVRAMFATWTGGEDE